MKKRSLGLLFSVVFMDMVGFGFIIPFLPDYVASFSASQEMLGLILGIYALGQFFAAPIVGSLSDRFGRKPLLLLSIGGTFVSLLMLGFANTILLVLLSRLLDGLTGGNITVAQSYISDVTDEESRAKGLGLIGMAFGLGFILGPVFGGLLAQISLSLPAFVAAGIALLNLLLITFVLPESLPKESRQNVGRIQLFDVQVLRAAWTNKPLLSILGMTFAFALAFNIFETMFTPHAMLALGLSVRTRGFVLAYMGVVVAGVQGGLMGYLTKRFDEDAILRVTTPVMAVSLALWAFVPNLVLLLVVILPISVAAGVQGVVMKSLLTKRADEGDRGAVLGLSTSLESANRVIAPMLGGILITRVGTWAPGVLSALVLLVPVVLVASEGIRQRTVGKVQEKPTRT